MQVVTLFTLLLDIFVVLFIHNCIMFLYVSHFILKHMGFWRDQFLMLEIEFVNNKLTHFIWDTILVPSSGATLNSGAKLNTSFLGKWGYFEHF